MSVELDDLVQASELVAKVVWGDEPAAVLGESIEAVSATINQLEGVRLGMVRSFEGRGEHRTEGHASVTPWLQHHGRLKKREARRVARLSRFADRLPAAGEALLAGTVTFDHLEVLADAHKERTHEAWAEAAPLLLGYAAEARFEDFARQVQRFAHQLEPLEAEERFTEQVDDRSFTKTTTLDGFGFLRGWMEPFGYQIFCGEHDRLTNELFEGDWAELKALLGRDPTAVEVHDLVRSADQRSHDALVQMALRSRAATGSGNAMVEALIHIDGPSFAEAIRHLLAEDPDDPPQYPPDGFCETADGSVISPVAAVYLALLGQVRGIVFDEEGNVLTYGRSRRLFTPAQAAALRAKYRRCTHPYGCDRTGPLLQTDHITEHQDGGPTDLTNGQPLCATHNRWKTNQRGHPPPPGRHDHDQRRAPPDLRG